MTPPAGLSRTKPRKADREEAVDWSESPDDEVPVVDLPLSAEAQRRLKRKRQAFVKGPLPLGWLTVAVRCGDARALPVLLAVKAKADSRREAWVKTPRAVLCDFGIGAMAMSRAIAALEQAGLIQVIRRKGRPSLVRLVPWGKGNSRDG